MRFQSACFTTWNIANVTRGLIKALVFLFAFELIRIVDIYEKQLMFKTTNRADDSLRNVSFWSQSGIINLDMHLKQDQVRILSQLIVRLIVCRA